MKEILLCILVPQLLCVPIYFALAAERKERETEGEAEAQKAALEVEMALDNAKYHAILYDALKAFRKVGTGVSYITPALQAEDLDQETALMALQLSRDDTMRWANDSTVDSRRHWRQLAYLFDKFEEKIKGEGV